MGDLYFKYWGKAGSDDEKGNSYHLLPYHCLDVAAVAKCWWESSRSFGQQFTQIMELENEHQAKAWVLFFIALHDLGKLDIRFQMKAQQVVVQLQPDIPKNVNKVKTEYAHGEAGYAWFWYELDSYGINSLEKRRLAKWMVQVAGHHGIIPSDNQAIQQISGVSPVLKTRDQQARIAWISDLQRIRLDCAV